MKKLLFLLILLFVFSSTFAQMQKTRTEHFKASYNIEIEEYAQASLKVLEEAWSIATNNGFYLPKTIIFSIVASERNALYFNRKNLREITWEYKTKNDFLPPDQSRKNNVYGLCHEIGHLCMYNTNHNRNSWMSYDYRESWADYFANTLIDSVYENIGINFWPEPHDYRKYAGREFFLKRLEKDNPDLRSFNQACLFWYEFGEIVGFSNICRFFDSINSQKVDNPEAKGKFTNVLKDYVDQNEVDEWKEKYADNLIINKE